MLEFAVTDSPRVLKQLEECVEYDFFGTSGMLTTEDRISSPFTDTSVKTRVYSKQERCQDNAFKWLFQFWRSISDNFLLGNKTHPPKCLVINLDLLYVSSSIYVKKIKLIYYLKKNKNKKLLVKSKQGGSETEDSTRFGAGVVSLGMSQ